MSPKAREGVSYALTTVLIALIEKYGLPKGEALHIAMTTFSSSLTEAKELTKEEMREIVGRHGEE